MDRLDATLTLAYSHTSRTSFTEFQAFFVKNRVTLETFLTISIIVAGQTIGLGVFGLFALTGDLVQDIGLETAQTRLRIFRETCPTPETKHTGAILDF